LNISKKESHESKKASLILRFGV